MGSEPATSGVFITNPMPGVVVPSDWAGFTWTVTLGVVVPVSWNVWFVHVVDRLRIWDHEVQLHWAVSFLPFWKAAHFHSESGGKLSAPPGIWRGRPHWNSGVVSRVTETDGTETEAISLIV